MGSDGWTCRGTLIMMDVTVKEFTYRLPYKDEPEANNESQPSDELETCIIVLGSIDDINALKVFLDMQTNTLTWKEL